MYHTTYSLVNSAPPSKLRIFQISRNISYVRKLNVCLKLAHGNTYSASFIKIYSEIRKKFVDARSPLK